GWRSRKVSLPRSRGRAGWGLLTAVGDERGVEVVARVVAAGRDQPHSGMNVFQRTGLPLLLAGDLEILRAGVHRECDVLAVTGAEGDHAAADARDGTGDVRPADANALRVELAVARFVTNEHVAVDLDL